MAELVLVRPCEKDSHRTIDALKKKNYEPSSYRAIRCPGCDWSSGWHLPWRPHGPWFCPASSASFFLCAAAADSTCSFCSHDARSADRCAAQHPDVVVPSSFRRPKFSVRRNCSGRDLPARRVRNDDGDQRANQQHSDDLECRCSAWRRDGDLEAVGASEHRSRDYLADRLRPAGAGIDFGLTNRCSQPLAAR
jgi:hypothetical protein